MFLSLLWIDFNSRCRIYVEK